MSPFTMVNLGGSAPSTATSDLAWSAAPCAPDGVTGVRSGGGGSGANHGGLGQGEEPGEGRGDEGGDGEEGLLTTTWRGIGPGLRLLGNRGDEGSLICDELRFVLLL